MKPEKITRPERKPLSPAELCPAPMPLVHARDCQSADDWQDIAGLDPFDLLDLTKGH